MKPDGGTRNLLLCDCADPHRELWLNIGHPLHNCTVIISIAKSSTLIVCGSLFGLSAKSNKVGITIKTFKEQYIFALTETLKFRSI